MDVSGKTEVRSSSRGQTAKTFAGRPWLLTILLASALCLFYLIGVLVHWQETADRSLYANLGMIPIGLLASILALSAAKIQPDRRRAAAWHLLGAGLACFWVGDLLFFMYTDVLGTSPFPSWADAGYIAYYPLAFAGLLCFRGLPVSRLHRVSIYLGCFLVLAVGGAAITYLLLLPTLQSRHDDLLAYSLSAGYPVGDLLLLAGIAWILLRRVEGHRWSILLLSAGLAAGLIADVSYGYASIQGTFESGGFSDAGYMLSWALFAWAGYLEVSRKRAQSTDLPRTERAR